MSVEHNDAIPVLSPFEISLQLPNIHIEEKNKEWYVLKVAIKNQLLAR